MLICQPSLHCSFLMSVLLIIRRRIRSCALRLHKPFLHQRHRLRQLPELGGCFGDGDGLNKGNTQGEDEAQERSDSLAKFIRRQVRRNGRAQPQRSLSEQCCTGSTALHFSCIFFFRTELTAKNSPIRKITIRMIRAFSHILSPTFHKDRQTHFDHKNRLRRIDKTKYRQSSAHDHHFHLVLCGRRATVSGSG